MVPSEGCGEADWLRVTLGKLVTKLSHLFLIFCKTGGTEIRAQVSGLGGGLQVLFHLQPRGGGRPQRQKHGSLATLPPRGSRQLPPRGAGSPPFPGERGAQDVTLGKLYWLISCLQQNPPIQHADRLIISEQL